MERLPLSQTAQFPGNYYHPALGSPTALLSPRAAYPAGPLMPGLPSPPALNHTSKLSRSAAMPPPYGADMSVLYSPQSGSSPTAEAASSVLVQSPSNASGVFAGLLQSTGVSTIGGSESTISSSGREQTNNAGKVCI